MKTYIVCRWGNVDEGPNGEDTMFLVAAETVEEAGRVADASLVDYPWINGPNVAGFTNMVAELGASLAEEATVIHGPWTKNVILRGFGLGPAIWHRDVETMPWERVNANE